MAVSELWETLKAAITAYTGLSPVTFFTILAVAVAFYYAVSGFFAPPLAPRMTERSMPEMEPLPPPVQLGEITEEDLRVYDGSDPKKPLLMAIKGQIYDVSQSRMFYGPGGPYALFTGKDASRALAKMSFEEKDLTGDISGLGPFELEALQDWEYKFMSKYVKVGEVKKAEPVTDESTSTTTTTTTFTTTSITTTTITETPEPVSHASESDPANADADADHNAEPKEVTRSADGPEAEKVELLGGEGAKE